MDYIDKTNSLIQEMLDVKKESYLDKRIPCELDERIIQIIKTYVDANETTRNDVLEELDYLRTTWCLLNFSQRMAVLAVRNDEPRRIFEGIMAHVLADNRIDIRENMINLSLLIHSAMKINADFTRLAEEALKFASRKSFEHMERIIERKITRYSLEDIKYLGYVESERDDGFWYKWVGVPTFEK